MEHIDEKQPPDVITSDTDNATQIRPEEAPRHKQKQFRRFRAYNTGLWNGPLRENKEAIRRQDDLHLYDAISAQVGLNRGQKKRGRNLLDRFSIGDYTKQRRSASAVVFALCAALANADVPEGTVYWPGRDVAVNDPDFDRVAESIDCHWTDMRSLVLKLKYRFDL